MNWLHLLGIPIGLVIFNLGEWLFHKYFLHGLGKKKLFWESHWHQHHRNARKHDNYDQDYNDSLLKWESYGMETLGLILVGIIHIPVFFFFPIFAGTIWVGLAYYWYVHRKAHKDPEWSKTRLTHHYDHHMGPNQDANWCVTFPLMDLLLGTRERYYGTERYERDQEKRLKKTLRGTDPLEEAAQAIFALSSMEPGDAPLHMPLSEEAWEALEGGMMVHVNEDGSLDIQSLGINNKEEDE